MEKNSNILSDRKLLGKTLKETVKNRIALEIIKNSLHPETNKVWFNKKEASEYLSISTRQIDRYRTKNQLKSYQSDINGRVRFKLVDLDNFLNCK